MRRRLGIVIKFRRKLFFAPVLSVLYITRYLLELPSYSDTSAGGGNGWVKSRGGETVGRTVLDLPILILAEPEPPAAKLGQPQWTGDRDAIRPHLILCKHFQETSSVVGTTPSTWKV